MLEGGFVKIKCKVWLEKDRKVIFGRGREDLFTAIDACGSLYGAAKKLNMSYRAAWGIIKVTEQRLGLKLVETTKGNKGMRLTQAAKTLLHEFHHCEEDIESYIESKAYHFILPPNTSLEQQK